jgi:AraC-like DNA-binding protein
MNIVFIAMTNRTKNISKTLLIWALLSASCLYIDALPPGIALPDAYEIPLEFISIFCIGFIWLFVLSILEDDFCLGFVEWTGMLLIVAGSLVTWVTGLMGIKLGESTYLFLSVSWYSISALLVLHVFWVALSGYMNDLIIDRRVIRLCITTIGMMAIVINLAADFLIGNFEQRLLRVVVSLPISLMLMFWLLRFNDNSLIFDVSKPNTNEDIAPHKLPSYRRLMQIIEQDQAYLDAELTVDALAKRVGIPAHQLRVLINKSLGFKNFQSFLAKYRIEAVKQILSKPEQNYESISTIAYNHGFSSIATFNRTFKNNVGLSAGQFRNSVQKTHSNR